MPISSARGSCPRLVTRSWPAPNSTPRPPHSCEQSPNVDDENVGVCPFEPPPLVDPSGVGGELGVQVFELETDVELRENPNRRAIVVVLVETVVEEPGPRARDPSTGRRFVVVRATRSEERRVGKEWRSRWSP